MNPFEAPGLRFVGEYQHPRVNHGQPLPVFEPVPPADRPSINTTEGWEAMANECNSRFFQDIFGRAPSCVAELRAWENSHFSKAFKWEGMEIPA